MIGSLLGVLLLVAGIGIFSTSGIVGVLAGSALTLLGLGVSYRFLSRLIPPTQPQVREETKVPDELEAPAPAGHKSAEEALKEHARDLHQLEEPQGRAQVLLRWRGAIDRQAHDYADLVLSSPRREDIERAEVETIMQAYFFGLLARKSWVQQVEASQGAFRLGRAFRNRLRNLGVSLDQLEPSLGVVIDDALREIVHFGAGES